MCSFIQVGSLPTRFSYTRTKPTNYGLTPAEILLATDAELNEFVGMKQFAPYRRDGGTGWDGKRGEKLSELRKKLGERGVTVGGGEHHRGNTARGGAVEGPMKKRMGKKERMKLKQQQGENGAATEDAVMTEPHDAPPPATEGKTKKRKRDEPAKQTDAKEVTTAPAGEDGASGKRKRKRRRKAAGIAVDGDE
jgi:protein KRI1